MHDFSVRPFDRATAWEWEPTSMTLRREEHPRRVFLRKIALPLGRMRVLAAVSNLDRRFRWSHFDARRMTEKSCICTIFPSGVIGPDRLLLGGNH
jgi:hypothetical protein